jgi:hypothetical protein
MWITINDGKYGFLRWPWSAERGREEWKGAPPKGAVAIVHTHPSAKGVRPSMGDRPSDQATAKQVNMPVYVVHRDGIAVIHPNAKNPSILYDYRWRERFEKK